MILTDRWTLILIQPRLLGGGEGGNKKIVGGEYVIVLVVLVLMMIIISKKMLSCIILPQKNLIKISKIQYVLKHKKHKIYTTYDIC